MHQLKHGCGRVQSPICVVCRTVAKYGMQQVKMWNPFWLTTAASQLFFLAPVVLFQFLKFVFKLVDAALVLGCIHLLLDFLKYQFGLRGSL